MLFKSFLIVVTVAAAAVNGNPLQPIKTEWYAPLVASRAAGIHLSQKSSEQILHNEFWRMIVDNFSFGQTCAPEYFEISAQPELVYYDVNRTEHRSDTEMQCTLNSFHLGSDVFFVPYCSGDDKIGLQFGHVDVSTNKSFVIFEECVDNKTEHTIFSRSHLHRESITGVQLPLETIALRTFADDNIGHNTIDESLSKELTKISDLFEVKIVSDKLPDGWKNSANVNVAVRSYGTWERYLHDAHKLGLGYMEFDAPKISPLLVPVLEHMRYRASIDDGVLFYTSFSGETEVLGGADGITKVKVPEFVWFVLTAVVDDSEKAIVYIVPNGAYAVDPKLCANKCDAAVYCCEIGDFMKQLTQTSNMFEGKFEML